MFRNNFALAVRNIFRERKYSLMNILGLFVGLVCSLFMFLYLQHELNYDIFYKYANRIYRVVGNIGAYTQDLLEPALDKFSPEIKDMTRIQADIYDQCLIRFQDKEFHVSNFWRADANFFDLFSFDFIKGDPKTALVRPNCVVITKEMADKIFGDVNPINQIIQYDNSINFKITGVIQNIPDNSPMKFNFLAS